MTKVTITYRHDSPPEIREFTYAHNARHWLLLSGFLPIESDINHFAHYILGAEARLEIMR